MCYDADDHRQMALFPSPGDEKRGYLYAGVSHMRTTVKFGYTSRPPRRRGGELRDFDLLCYWPGDRYDEQRVHRELEPWRVLGNQEWYALTPEIHAFLVQKCQEGNFPRGLRILRNLTEVPAQAA
jgi:hypothetical protein